MLTKNLSTNVTKTSMIRLTQYKVQNCQSSTGPQLGVQPYICISNRTDGIADNNMLLKLGNVLDERRTATHFLNNSLNAIMKNMIERRVVHSLSNTDDIVRDCVLKKILKLSTHRFEVFSCEGQYLILTITTGQVIITIIPGQLRKHDYKTCSC